MFLRTSLLNLEHLLDRIGITYRLWLPPLIIGSTLLAALLLPRLDDQRLHYAIIALPIVIAGVLFLLRWPQLGLLGIIAGLLIPFDGPSGINVSMLAVAGMLGLWFVKMMVEDHVLRFVDTPANLPLILMLVSGSVSFAAGQLSWFYFARQVPLAAQLAGLSLFFLSAGAFWLVVNYITTEQSLIWLQWMVWLFLIIGGFYVLGEVVPPVQQITQYIYNASATGSLFWTWLLVLAAGQALYNTNLAPGWRVLLGGLALAVVYVGLFKLRAWNSGWVPPLAGLALLLVLGTPRLIIPIGIAGLIAIALQFQTLVGFIMIGDNEYSLGTRLDAWAIVWEITQVSPWIGLGPANYYAYTPLFPIRGWAVNFNSHQQFMDILAQTGIIGLLIFLWVFAVIAWLGWELIRHIASIPAGFHRAYIFSAMGGLGGTMVAAVFGDWVIPFFYNIGLRGFRASVLGWVFLGGLVALHHIYRRARHQTIADTSLTSDHGV